MSDLAPTEIQALARIMDELDYYQLMHVERGATGREVKTAYHSTSRIFHPDANRHLDPGVVEESQQTTLRTRGHTFRLGLRWGCRHGRSVPVVRRRNHGFPDGSPPA